MHKNLSCMWLIFLFNFLPFNIQFNGQHQNWASTNDFIKSLLCWKIIRFDNLDKTDNFLPAFVQRDEYSLKLKSLSITTPKNFYFKLSQIFTSPIRVQMFSCLYPKTSIWHLSWFGFMRLLSNHSTAKWLSCYNLLIKVFKSSSQAKKVVPFPKL